MTKMKGHGVEDVDDAHHELVNAAAGEACDSAPGDADDQADERGDEAHGKRNLKAGDDAGDHIATVDVCAQPMHAFERGADAELVLVLCVEFMRPDEGADDGDQGEQT
jgi:hypothetical protein